MEESTQIYRAEPVAAPQGFVAYTAFAAAEEVIEQHLGPQAKFLLPLRHQLAYVRYLPWAVVMILPLHFALVLVVLGASVLATLLGSPSVVGGVLAAAVFSLNVIALPGLFRRTRRGWAFFTYAIVVGMLSSLQSVSLLGLLIDVAVLWSAFQVKPHYT